MAVRRSMPQPEGETVARVRRIAGLYKGAQLARQRAERYRATSKAVVSREVAAVYSKLATSADDEADLCMQEIRALGRRTSGAA